MTYAISPEFIRSRSVCFSRGRVIETDASSEITQKYLYSGEKKIIGSRKKMLASAVKKTVAQPHWFLCEEKNHYAEISVFR